MRGTQGRRSERHKLVKDYERQHTQRTNMKQNNAQYADNPACIYSIVASLKSLLTIRIYPVKR